MKTYQLELTVQMGDGTVQIFQAFQANTECAARILGEQFVESLGFQKPKKIRVFGGYNEQDYANLEF